LPPAAIMLASEIVAISVTPSTRS